MVYDASEGDVLKFQAFQTSWKNVSCSLGTVNEVLESTGTCHTASMGATGPAFTTGIQLTLTEFRQPLQVQSHLEMPRILVQLGHTQRT